MILLLGSSGYIGQAFAAELKRRDWEFFSLARSRVDYTSFPILLEYLQRTRPQFLINAAGYTGNPNVDVCEYRRAETFLGNTLLPHTIAHACAVAGIPWGHVSSGCIFSGGKVLTGGRWRIEKDLSSPEFRNFFQRQPEAFRGFDESDNPNFSFRTPPCSFYSGTKALGEEVICGTGQSYIWRLRMPFDEQDSCRNYLSKLLRYARIYQNINSLSHRGDYARACLDLWDRKAPFGIYNITNPGAVSTSQVVEMIQKVQCPDREFVFWRDDAEFYRLGAKAPRSNCILDVSKLLNAGVVMRPVEEALIQALKNWKPEG